MRGKYKLTITVLFVLALFVGCKSATEGKNKQEATEKDPKTEDQKKEDNQQESDLVWEDEGMDPNNEEDIEEPSEEVVGARYKVNEIWSIVPIEDANEKVVLLTIDDAPDKHALEMAKTLQALEANAIFFVNGHFLETTKEKEILKEIYDMGFVIGNHTYSHANLSDISNDEQKEEIIRVNDMVEEITGERPVFFRAPFGVNTDYSKEVAKTEGMVLMNWTYGYDWDKAYMFQEAITDIMINTELLRGGANLLMHDREWTAAALHDIVTGLRDKGYEMVDPLFIETIEVN